MTQRIITRRVFLRAAASLGLSAAVLVLLPEPTRVWADDPQWEFFKTIKDPKNPTPEEKEHLIDIRLPVIAEDGANVPIIVSMAHPMEGDHYIKNLQIVNFADPVIGKGVYRFSPANGQAYISTQLRMDGGDPTIFVIAECSKHGRWVASRKLKVSLGGC